MKADTRIKLFVVCSVSLACLIVCGCNGEQSNKRRYFANQKRYFVSTQRIISTENRLNERGEQYQQEEMGHYTPEVNDALNYVHQHSTERMKKYISRGKLVYGMNQKEVIACLHTIHFRDGVPVTSKIYNSKYGKYETWIVGGSSGSKYSSYSLPKYTLDFTFYILTGIHEAKALQVNDNLHLARAK